MSKPTQKSAWVTRADRYQWAMTYLERKRIKTPGGPSAKELFERLRLVDRIKESTDENRALLKQMQDAWRKRESRARDNQKDKKPHSFVLSETAGRQLHRLSDDFRETQIRTLEIIIADSLERENQYKADRKDEGVFKKRATIFERELNRALDELHEYEFRLSQAGVNIASPLDNKQQKTVKSLSRARKSEIIRQLPALPPANTPKKVKKVTTTTKKKTTKCSQAGTPDVVSENPTINPNQIKEQQIDEAHGEAIESQNDTPSNNLSNAASEASPDQTGAMTTPAIADTAQQPQQAFAAGKSANDEVTVTPATTQASSAHLNEHHDNDDAQQIPADTSSEIDPEPANAQTTNLNSNITAQKPSESPVTEPNDECSTTGANALPHSMQNEQSGCEQLDEIGNRHKFTDEDTAELKRLLRESES